MSEQICRRPSLPVPLSHAGGGKKRGRKRTSCEDCFRRKIRCDGAASDAFCVRSGMPRKSSLPHSSESNGISLSSTSLPSLRESHPAAAAASSSSSSVSTDSATQLISLDGGDGTAASNQTTCNGSGRGSLGAPFAMSTSGEHRHPTRRVRASASAFRQHVMPLFSETETTSVASLALVRAAFLDGWNWVYEVVEESAVDALFDKLGAAILRRDDAVNDGLDTDDFEHSWHVCLALAMVLAGVHVAEFEVACSVLQHNAELPVRHDYRTCHEATKKQIDRALCATVKTLVTEGNTAIDLSFVQTMLIHSLVYISEARCYRTLTSFYGRSLFDGAIEARLLTHGGNSSHDRSDQKAQTCRRAFWNVVCVDRTALLSLQHPSSRPTLFDIPSQSIHAAIVKGQLPSLRPPISLKSDTSAMQEVSPRHRGRTWRYINSWMRARMSMEMTPICDAIDEFHQSKKRVPYSLITQTARRLELSAMLLPTEFRLDIRKGRADYYSNDNDDDLLVLQDPYVQRSRYLVGISYYRAHELLHRLAMTEIMEGATREQRRASGDICVDAANRVITCVRRGQLLGKNRGDTLHIWHSVLPTTILTLAAVCAAHALTETPHTIPALALQALSRANALLDVISDKRTSWRSLRILSTLQERVMQLRFLPSSPSTSDGARREPTEEAVISMRDAFTLQGCSALLERVRQRAACDTDGCIDEHPNRQINAAPSTATLPAPSPLEPDEQSSQEGIPAHLSSLDAAQSAMGLDPQSNKWLEDLLREHEEMQRQQQQLQQQRLLAPERHQAALHNSQHDQLYAVPPLPSPDAFWTTDTGIIDPMLHLLLPFHDHTTDSH